MNAIGPHAHVEQLYGTWSPHVGGYGDPDLLEGLARHFRANLDRFLAGEPLQDRVSLA
jgi:hypothetical protein